ncbi:GIY-YIG nuclease family protein [Bradyrhizobium elkanii]|uniref:GIY-YIG nuclease family protein n=1 Tax=Bradyrhizobium elkanii TaxID=29448 RepID=UPI0034E5D0E8
MKRCKVCEPRWCGATWLYVATARAGNYPVKVGISGSVGARMATHRKKEGRRGIYAAHRVEFNCEYLAAQAETIALNDLRNSDVNVKGDWFSCSTDRAIKAVNDAASLVAP